MENTEVKQEIVTTSESLDDLKKENDESTNNGQDPKFDDKPKKTFKEKLYYFYQNEKGWLYLLPVIVLMIIFTFYPIFQSLFYAFEEGVTRMDASYEISIGFQNFKDVLEYSKFRFALANTLLFAFISVPVSTLLALLVAVGLNSIKKFREVLQTIYFLPYLTNSIAIGAVFAAMFAVIGVGNNIQSYGLINTIFGSKVDWLNVAYIQDTSHNGFQQWLDAFFDGTIWPARLVVIIYEVWAGMPFKILILFSALQNVNKDYYDAAKIDGTSKFRTLTKITVPLISPMLSYLIITGFIGGFKAYTALVGIFGSQTVESGYMNTMVGYIYSEIRSDNIGRASAGALLLFVIIFIFTQINLHVSKKRVHY
jgi:multiple sugar transport system permease protein